MGYYTEKAKEVKAKQEAEVNELLQLIADAVEEKYQEDMEVINNVQNDEKAD
jgi:hypothetical protein